MGPADATQVARRRETRTVPAQASHGDPDERRTAGGKRQIRCAEKAGSCREWECEAAKEREFPKATPEVTGSARLFHCGRLGAGGSNIICASCKYSPHPVGNNNSSPHPHFSVR